MKLFSFSFSFVKIKFYNFVEFIFQQGDYSTLFSKNKVFFG